MRGKSLTLSVPFLLFYFLKSMGVCAVLLPPPWICLGFSISWGVVGRYIVQCTPVLTLLTVHGMILDLNLQLNHKITGFEGKSPIAECGQSSLYQNLLSFSLVGETPLPVRTSFFFRLCEWRLPWTHLFSCFHLSLEQFLVLWDGETKIWLFQQECA